MNVDIYAEIQSTCVSLFKIYLAIHRSDICNNSHHLYAIMDRIGPEAFSIYFDYLTWLNGCSNKFPAKWDSVNTAITE